MKSLSTICAHRLGGHRVLRPLLASFLAVASASAVIAAVYEQNFDYPDFTTDLGDGSSLRSTNDGIYRPIVVNGKLQLTDINRPGVYTFYEIRAIEGSSYGWTAEYEMTIQGNNGFAADGVYFDYTKQGDRTTELRVGVDTWNNGNGDQGIFFEVGGLAAAYRRNFNPLDGASAIIWNVKIEWDTTSGMSLWVNGNPEFLNIATSDYVGDDAYIYAFTGATGAVSETVLIDNLLITTKGIPSVSLMVLPSEGGIINGAGNYTTGSAATIAAVPNPGFVFIRWTGDASGTESPFQLLMDAPKTIGALFSQDTSDVDGDGLTAYEEAIVFGTSPALADTDKDGIPDGQETGVGIFSIVDRVFTWEQARVDALARGGRLAAFDSQSEWQGALIAVGPDALDGRLGIWIGATDQAEEGTWRWVTGEPFTFQNWAQGEPDNANDSDFAEVAGSELGLAGKWYDRRATTLRDGYLLEKGYASSPLKEDSDNDGLKDAEEKTAGTHPLLADTDSDGLSDVQEIQLSQTSPVRADTDGDGQEDTIEDPDADGLTNAQEILEFQTNPLIADSDGDGFNDLFELSSGFDPTNKSSTPDAITTILPAVEFRFNAAAGVSYRIEGSDDLQNWVVIEASVVGQGASVTRLYSIENHPTRYLRVRRN